jgi:hypothetical protein
MRRINSISRVIIALPFGSRAIIKHISPAIDDFDIKGASILEGDEMQEISEHWRAIAAIVAAVAGIWAVLK